VSTNPESQDSQRDRITRISELMLSLVPRDGSPIGNAALRRKIEARLAEEGASLGEEEYWQAHSALIAQGLLLPGRGRGGSVRRRPRDTDRANSEHAEAGDSTPFALAAQDASVTSWADKPTGRKVATAAATRTTNVQPPRAAGGPTQIVSYRHSDKRKNNPEVGMVNPATRLASVRLAKLYSLRRTEPPREPRRL
jgi:adenine-specific DNA-methyltransferase